MDNQTKLCPFRKEVFYDTWTQQIYGAQFSGQLPMGSTENFMPCLGEACAAYNNHYLSQSKCLLIGDKK